VTGFAPMPESEKIRSGTFGLAQLLWNFWSEIISVQFNPVVRSLTLKIMRGLGMVAS
jgi:hypothetical protein